MEAGNINVREMITFVRRSNLFANISLYGSMHQNSRFYSLPVPQAADAGLTDFLRGLQVEIDDVVKSNQRPGPFRQ